MDKIAHSPDKSSVTTTFMELLYISGCAYGALSAGIGVAASVALARCSSLGRQRSERESMRSSSWPDEPLTLKEVALVLERMEEETWDDL